MGVDALSVHVGETPGGILIVDVWRCGYVQRLADVALQRVCAAGNGSFLFGAQAELAPVGDRVDAEVMATLGDRLVVLSQFIPPGQQLLTGVQAQRFDVRPDMRIGIYDPVAVLHDGLLAVATASEGSA